MSRTYTGGPAHTTYGYQSAPAPKFTWEARDPRSKQEVADEWFAEKSRKADAYAAKGDLYNAQNTNEFILQAAVKNVFGADWREHFPISKCREDY